MKSSVKHISLALTALLVFSLTVCVGLAIVARAAGATYYVDCSAPANGDGSQSSPWNNLTTPSSTTFSPGDSILLKRGTVCSGQLWPKGSGTAASPITIGAYGTGALPIVNGGTSNDAAVKLYNQQGWHVESIEITGGNRFGLWIGGNSGSLNHFRVTNVVAHDVTGVADSKNNGLIDVEVDWGSSAVIGDVIIDGATAYNTQQWNGIRIMCAGAMVFPGNQPVIIRNSTVHDVGGDGIVIFTCNDGLIENTVAWETGKIATDAYGTPNSTWTWSCKDCTVQFNEAYLAHSPSWDGGGFDIDYPDQNNLFQYNYGHDNDSYCVSVFGGDSGVPTLNNTVRYNVCSNNCRDGSYDVKRQGDIWFTVWSRATIQDTYVYNNTIYWNPANAAYYALFISNIWHGKAINNTNFYNNIIYADNPNLVNVASYTTQTHMDHNLYWYTGAGNPNFNWGGTVYTSFSAWQAGSAQDAHGLYADPHMNDPRYHGIGMPTTSFTLQSNSPAIDAGANLVALGLVPSMGARDFYGNSIPNGAYDIGAHEYGGTGPTPTDTPTPGPSPTPTNTPTPTPTPVPGNNLALNKPTEVSSYEQTYLMGDKAVDGDLATYWRSEKRSALPSEWIKVDLGSSLSISRVELEWNIKSWATAYTIQVSPDGSTWTTVATVTGADGGNDTVTFAATAARYVKMDSTAWSNATERCWLNEFEIYQ